MRGRRDRSGRGGGLAAGLAALVLCVAPAPLHAQAAGGDAARDAAVEAAEARIRLASERLAEGDFAGAETHLAAGRDEMAAALGPEAPQLVRPVGALSRLRLEQGRYTDALALIDQALVLSRAGGDDPATEGQLTYDRAMAFDGLGRYDQAEAAAVESLELRRRVHGPVHEKSADALNLYANTLAAQGRHAEADPLYRQVLGLYEVLYGPKDPHVAIVLSNLANSLRRTGRAPQAAPLYRRAVAIAEISGDRVLLAQNLNNHGWFLHESGDSAKAEPLFRRALDLAVGLVGDAHPFTGVARANIGLSLLGQGRPREAEPVLAEGRRVLEAGLGPDSPDLIPTLRGHARALDALGRHDEAEAAHRQAWRTATLRLSPAHGERLAQAEAMAGFLLARDRPAEAMAELRPLLATLTGDAAQEATEDRGRDWRVGVRGARPAFARQVTAAWRLATPIQAD